MSRSERAEQARRLRATGLEWKQVAELLGMTVRAAQDLAYDPDYSRTRARKDGYRGTCEVCGAKTDGSGGRAKAPKLCKDCAPLATIDPCPSVASYQRGCRCEGCKQANRDYRDEMVERVRSEGRIVHGTANAYRNFGCRCNACRAAARADERRTRSDRIERLGTPHGTHRAYAYGCRCDACKTVGGYHRRVQDSR